MRVGRFGPYVEGTKDGETLTTSLPPETAPDEVTEEMLGELLERGNAADNVIGTFPETGQSMILKSGPYGPYLQLGDDEQEGKPKRTSLPRGVEPSSVTHEMAVGLLSLPRTVGEHPETGKPVQANIGRFGPYVKHGSTFASLPKEDDMLTVGFERALELITKKEHKNKPLKVLGEHPDTGEPIEVRDGRYGLYVKHQKTNASLQQGQTVDDLTMAEALDLLAEREKATGKTSTGKKATKKKTTKKASAKSKTKKKAAPKKPKATPKQLEPFLTELDGEVAKVVIRLEGMNGGQRSRYRHRCRHSRHERRRGQSGA